MVNTTLVDSNVLLDIATRDPIWLAWSMHQLEAAAQRGTVVINDVVYAESSVRYTSQAAFDGALTLIGLDIAKIPRAALFLAGKAHTRYRATGGTRTGVLSDFFIGAHAAVLGWRLLTRDGRGYRQYFPAVSLITPASTLS